VKRWILTSLAIVLIALGLPSKTYAATDGCPDTWNIDTTKYPNQELIDAKKRLGVKMAETIQIKTIEFKGPLGVMPADNGLIGYAGINPLAYLYYDSKIQTIIKVEVKDCTNAATFNFVSNWLNKEIEKFEITTASSFANQFPGRFTDFKKQQIFSESIAQLEKRLKEMIDGPVKTGMKRIPFQFIDASHPTNSRSIEIGRISLYTFALTPKCLAQNSDTNRFEIVGGIGDCKFAIGALASDGAARTIYLFDPFTINLSSKNSITCIKGKTTKKVTGAPPKCPKGFKLAI
jgi:hypothetical protein